ncbi:MAG: NifB/NifX family molybdenum-iron cluster-binding protein [Candidatus Thorarchaeota archaeon]
MVERIVIPVLDESGKTSRLSPHFGRAPFFAVVKIKENGLVENIVFQPNRSEHFGGQGHPPDIILGFAPQAVITYGMGPRAMRRFQSERVAVMQATADTLEDVITAYIQNELKELTEGCREARHK